MIEKTDYIEDRYLRLVVMEMLGRIVGVGVGVGVVQDLVVSGLIREKIGEIMDLVESGLIREINGTQWFSSPRRKISIHTLVVQVIQVDKLGIRGL
jgi:hypothetical protein